ncbi:MAG TPA: hypothetical protein VFG20_15380 [Planctomycetaceae bacterium]|nr:hypothetical protein [Planctomycetaceae bacterium]
MSDSLLELNRIEAVSRENERFTIQHFQRIIPHVQCGRSSMARVENVFLTDSGLPVVKKGEDRFWVARNGVQIEVMANHTAYADRLARFRSSDRDAESPSPDEATSAKSVEPRPQFAAGQIWRRKQGEFIRIIAVNERITIATRPGVEFEVHKYLAAALLTGATLVPSESRRFPSARTPQAEIIERLCDAGQSEADIIAETGLPSNVIEDVRQRWLRRKTRNRTLESASRTVAR